jgi:hypothetical protein
VKVQEQFKAQGFVVVASHCQQVPREQVVALCRQQHINYTVVSNGRLSGDDSNGIPHAWLIDASGKVVKEGHPEEMRSTLEQLLQTEPHWVLGGKKPEAAGAKAISEGLKAGKPFGWALEEADKLGKKDAKAKDEAEAIKTAILAEGARLIEVAKSSEDGDPDQAKALYEEVSRSFKKSEPAAQADVRLKELGKDKAFQNELKAAKLVAQIRELCGQLKDKNGSYDLQSPANQSTAAQINAAVKQLKAKHGDTKVAAKCLEEIKLYGF